MKTSTQNLLVGDQILLLSPSLEANVLELVDCMGFHLLAHIPNDAARLRLGDADLLLLQDRGEDLNSSKKLASQRVRLWVSGIFDIYVKLSRKIRHRLSSPPRLSPQGHWEFSVADSFGHNLCFSQSPQNQVFTLVSNRSPSSQSSLGESK